MADGDVAASIEAFHYVQVLRFRHHHDLAQARQPLHNHVDPYALNSLEQRFLVEALRQAKTLQERIGRTQLGTAAV